ncbi:MAG: hypothetical protein K2L51_07190, partial [Clostridiales bacterium]|nr:hypothetical protein [Clostridiales bacterium]
MLYDAYKQKIQRLAAVRRFLWKWKVPLIVVLSLLVAFVTTYICLKGKITQNVSLVSDTVTYGETPELNGAKAMLGGVKGYEYRAEGDKKWSKTMPKKAGTY